MATLSRQNIPAVTRAEIDQQIAGENMWKHSCSSRLKAVLFNAAALAIIFLNSDLLAAEPYPRKLIDPFDTAAPGPVITSLAAAPMPGLPVLSVADGIESSRLMTDGAHGEIAQSPDQRQYAMMTIKGDIAADGIRISLLTGSLDSLAAARPRTVAQFFTRGLGAATGFGNVDGSTWLTSPAVNPPRWLNNEVLALLSEDANGITQVISINVSNRKRRFLTSSTTDVLSFVVSPDGALIYDARAQHSRVASEKLLHDGFAVTSPDALPLLAGIVDGTSADDFGNCDRFVIRSTQRSAVRVKPGQPQYCLFSSLLPASQLFLGANAFSPDGRYALVNSAVETVPDNWTEYAEPRFQSWLRQRKKDPEALLSRFIQQLSILNISDSTVRPLFDAPVNLLVQSRVVWARDGGSVALWPTFMPTGRSDSAGLRGQAVALIDLVSGSISQIPVSEEKIGSLSKVAVVSSGAVEAEFSDGSSVRFEKGSDGWQMTGAPIATANITTSGDARIRVEVKQDMNTPPALYGIDQKTKQELMLLDFNPRLRSGVAFGRVTFVHWLDPDGRRWKGRLYYPARYTSGQRYPLVIQPHGFADETEFSIYGQGANGGSIGLGPGWSVYLAQALAGQDIFVLQTGGPTGGFEEAVGELETIKKGAAGWGAAAEYLISAGLVNRDAVGVMGHSSSGRIVEYSLAHGVFPYAAAIAADHGDTNYFQAALSSWSDFSADANGSPPFGTGLQGWIENSPAFNVEKINTPLQLQVTSSSEGFGTLLWGWEMFSRLRYLKKPVEYYVAPDVRHGSHTLQNPRQLLILQNRALDWWCFWLKGVEFPGAERVEQYLSWRALKKSHVLATDLAQHAN